MKKSVLSLLVCLLLLLAQSVTSFIVFENFAEDIKYYIEFDRRVSNVAEAREECGNQRAILAHIYSEIKQRSQNPRFRFHRENFLKTMKEQGGLFIPLFCVVLQN